MNKFLFCLAVLGLGLGAQAEPEGRAPGAIKSFSVSLASVTAGGALSGTIILDSPGPSAAGTYVTLSLPRSLVAGPVYLRIPPKSTRGSFTIRTNPYIGVATPVTVSARTGSPNAASFFTAGFSIKPSTTVPTAPIPVVTSLHLVPNSVVNGTTVTGTLTLSSAPSVATYIQLGNPQDSLDLNASAPAFVTVLAGQTSVSFSVTTHLPSNINSVQQSIVANHFGTGFQGEFFNISR